MLKDYKIDKKIQWNKTQIQVKITLIGIFDPQIKSKVALFYSKKTGFSWKK